MTANGSCRAGFLRKQPRGGGSLHAELISVVKVDFLLKKSLLSDTLNITNLIRRNETDHGCKNACPVENTV